MNKEIAITILFLISCHLDCTRGLLCYQCIYENLDGAEIGNWDCLGEQYPIPEDLLVECEPQTQILFPTVIDGETETYSVVNITLGGLTYTLGLSPEEVTYACGKISVNGEVEGGEGSRMVRTCVPVLEELEETCETTSRDKWIDGDDEFSRVVVLASTLFPDEGQVHGCLCKEDGCNEGEVILGGNEGGGGGVGGSGKECYVCSYSKDGDEEDGRKECKEGDMLPEEFLMECNDDMELPSSIKGSRTVTLGEFKLSQGLSSQEEFTWGCGKISIAGMSNDNEISIILRTCVPSPAGIEMENTCKNDVFENWRQDGSQWSSFVTFVIDQTNLSGESIVEGGYCTDDKCNNDGDSYASCLVPSAQEFLEGIQHD